MKEIKAGGDFRANPTKMHSDYFCSEKSQKLVTSNKKHNTIEDLKKLIVKPMNAMFGGD